MTPVCARGGEFGTHIEREIVQKLDVLGDGAVEMLNIKTPPRVALSNRWSIRESHFGNVLGFHRFSIQDVSGGAKLKRPGFAFLQGVEF